MDINKKLVHDWLHSFVGGHELRDIMNHRSGSAINQPTNHAFIIHSQSQKVLSFIIGWSSFLKRHVYDI